MCSRYCHTVQEGWNVLVNAMVTLHLTRHHPSPHHRHQARCHNKRIELINAVKLVDGDLGLVGEWDDKKAAY